MNVFQKAPQAITARAVGAAAAVKAATRKFTSFLGRKESTPDPHAADDHTAALRPISKTQKTRQTIRCPAL